MSSLAYVISTRIRIARNLRNHTFPPNASNRERQGVLDCIRQALGKKTCCKDGTLILLDQLDPLERKVLEEKHLISHLFATRGSARAVMLSQARNCSILINEEDHLRIQAFSSALALHKSWRAAHAVERCLRKILRFAHTEHEGYLTSCPQNSGTGIRISAMLFLPGLILSHQITPIIQACIQDAYTVRGVYGEGSRTEGYVLQLSLRAPRSQPFEAVLEQYARRCHHIITQEKAARLALLTSPSSLLHKRVRWAKQQLKHSRRLSLASGLHILAIYRLVICLGLRSPDFRKAVMAKSERIQYLRGIDRLTRQIHTAHIRHAQLQSLSSAQPSLSILQDSRDDDIRASLLREGLKAVMEH